MPALRPRHAALLALSIASISFSAILARFAAEEATPLVIAFYRLFITTLLLLPAAVYTARRETARITGRDLALLAVVGFFLAAHFSTWITSLNLTSVAASVVIVATESLWVPLGAAFLLREHVGARVWGGVFIAFGGSILLVLGDRSDLRISQAPLLGDFLALAAALAASLYFLAGRRIRQRMGLFTYATIVYSWTSLFLLAFILFKHEPLWPYSRRTWLFLLAFAIFPMILGHTIINYLLRWVPPHYVSTAILAEPVVSALLAVVLLDEALLPLVAVGGAVILVGILVATTSRTPASSRAADVPPP